MVTKTKETKLLFILLGVSLIFPSVYFYRQLFPARIIPEEYQKYKLPPAEYAISRVLGKAIIEEAQKRKLKGYISSLQKISGNDDPEIASLTNDINLALGQYSGWKVIAPPEQLSEIKRRKDEDIARKRKLIEAGFLDPELYTRFLIQSERINVNYDVMAEWEWLPASRTNCKLRVSILNRSSGEVEFSEDVSFTHPSYYKKHQAIEKSVIYGTYVSAVLFTGSFWILLITEVKRTVKRHRQQKQIGEIYQKFDFHAESGQYVAAEQLIDLWLESFPKDSELIARKRKLLVITKNNPARAEEAYNSWQNFRAKLSQKVLLSDEEFQTFKELKNFLELDELSREIAAYESLLQEYFRKRQKEKLLQEYESKMKEVLYLMDQGNLVEARERQKHLQLEYGSQLGPDEARLLPEHSPVIQEIEEREKGARELFESGRDKINSGEISEGEKLLQEALRKNRNLSEASEILDKIGKSRRAEMLRLRPEKTGREVYIFKKDVITFFRKDKKKPDVPIQNQSVSRDRHLKLVIVNNKLIAEDMGSSNGTYIRGSEQINPRAEVEDGDMLNLAKVYKITVHLCRGEEIVPTTVMAGTLPPQMAISSSAIERQQKISGLFLETDDRDIIVLAGEKPLVPVVFKITGIDYEKSGNCQFSLDNGVFFLRLPEEIKILYPEEEINYAGLVYRIKTE